MEAHTVEEKPFSTLVLFAAVPRVLEHPAAGR